jgi:hypothetical protein
LQWLREARILPKGKVFSYFVVVVKHAQTATENFKKRRCVNATGKYGVDGSLRHTEDGDESREACNERGYGSRNEI